MIKVSVFTPTHNPQFIEETYASIKDQPYDEWVISLNNGAKQSDIPVEIQNDHRTRIIVDAGASQNIGAIKHFACSYCDGDILVELDHDDLLVNDAIVRIREAFQDPEVVFVYSNSAEFNHPDYSIRMYAEGNGWEYRDFYHDGFLYKEAVTPPSTPYHASLILWQPNHVRAFRKTAYETCGGYNPNLSICDDQDLMCRLYFDGKFRHINECCYLYRVHEQNTWLQRNADIQTEMFNIQKHYIRPMAEVWTDREGLLKLDLGGRFNSPEGYVSVDFKGGNVRCDLNKQWPFEDSSVGVIRAFDIIEHLKDPIHTMSEIHRVLIPGGYVFIEVPSTDGRGAWQDPMHISWWNENSFWYYTDRNLAQYIDNDTIKFKSIVLETHFPSDWHRQHNISYVRSDMVCVKDGVKLMGATLI